MAQRVASLLAFLSLISLAVAKTKRKYPPCRGGATYNLTIYNRWTPSRFNNIPPGAHFSPLTFFSHSPRFSSFVFRGYATAGVQAVAETGDNSMLKEELANAGTFVKQVSDTTGGAEPGSYFNTTVKVDCKHPFVSAITMVAPSPDWVIAIANLNVFRKGTFIERKAGKLRVYDAGTDSGKSLTADDKPTIPVENIVQLRGPPFRRRYIARYVLRRV